MEKLKDQVVSVKYSVPANARAKVELPYTIAQLLPDWRSEYRANISLDKDRTSEVPIIFGTGNDPVGTGVVTSLNRPGGNITGATFLTSALGAKRLGLLLGLLYGD